MLDQIKVHYLLIFFVHDSTFIKKMRHKNIHSLFIVMELFNLMIDYSFIFGVQL